MCVPIVSPQKEFSNSLTSLNFPYFFSILEKRLITSGITISSNEAYLFPCARSIVLLANLTVIEVEYQFPFSSS